MYTFVYKVYFFLCRMGKHKAFSLQHEPKWYRCLLNYCEWFFNVLVTKWYDLWPNQRMSITKVKRKQRIVVSLTTYPKRIGTVWFTIETLMRQSVKADEIVLWLADSQFPGGLLTLPERLRQQQKRGLTIRFCDDLRSHKKYYYALKEYSNDLVILADDDLFYPRDTIKKLLRMHRAWPEDICCITAQVIEPTFSSKPSLWRNPQINECGLQHTDRIQAFTGSGTLIPPNALPREAFDKRAISCLCPYADDLWISFMAHRNGTKISTLKRWRPFPVSIYGTAKDSLYYINGEAGQNDVQWKNLLEYYGVMSDDGAKSAKGADKHKESVAENM